MPAWVDQVAGANRHVPLDVPGLGLAIQVGPKVEAVAEGSPAARAGIKPGDTLRSLVFTPARLPAKSNRQGPVTIERTRQQRFPELAPGLRLRSAKIRWTSARGGSPNRTEKPIAIKPEVDPDRYHPIRGLEFQPLDPADAHLSALAESSSGGDGEEDARLGRPGIARTPPGLFAGARSAGGCRGRP